MANKHVQVLASKFQSTVFSGNSLNGDYEKINFEQDQDFDYNRLLSPDPPANFEITKAPLFSFDTDSHTLYLKQIPQEIKRAELLSTIKSNLPCFVHLSMSEPMRTHNFARLAWLNFETQHDCEQALQTVNALKLDDF